MPRVRRPVRKHGFGRHGRGVKKRGIMPVEKSRRGFASMSPERQREIASKGGRAAHQKGTGHEWTKEEAQKAGRKGGLVTGVGRRLDRQLTVMMEE